MKMKRLLTICAAPMALMLGVVVSTAFATIVETSVFKNPPNLGGKCRISDFGRRRQQADNFQLTGPYLTITEVHWWGEYGSFPDPAPTDDFVIRFFSNTRRKPSVVPFAEMPADNLTRTPAYTTDLALRRDDHHDEDTIYHYSADLPSPLTLNPGTTYYLSVVNNTKSSWGWLEDGARSHCGDRSHWFRYGDENDEHAWRTSCRNRNLSFELFAIPEPATITILLTGMLALAGWHRRRAEPH